MKTVIVTGMSGAGKSMALKSLEDMGYEAIDNVPLSLLPQLIVNADDAPRMLAIGTDIRSREFSVERFFTAMEHIREHKDADAKVIFLDCDDEILRSRYTETRRRHPLAKDRPVTDGIRLERTLMFKIRDAADLVIDTTNYALADLRSMLREHFASDKRTLSLQLISFAYKRGLPRDADLVFDVRFLKNPYYVPELKRLNGLNPDVAAYIEADPGFSAFFTPLTGLLFPLLPRYLEEGKSYLTLAFGCSGGQHRSVYMVEKLASLLREMGYKVGIRHREIR